MLNGICHSRPVFTNQASHTPMAHADLLQLLLGLWRLLRIDNTISCTLLFAFSFAVGTRRGPGATFLITWIGEGSCCVSANFRSPKK